jgi:hypothetical protein
MVDTSQKRRRKTFFREPLDARAVLAKCAAGLIVIVGIALLGISTIADDGAKTASISAPRAANGR